MDFAAMKRRELQALCKRHGLAGGGTNADLFARLTATLPGSGGAAAEAVGVVVGKGCLKRSAGGASGGDSDAAKKVSFEIEEDEEAGVGGSGRGRRRSQVMSSPAVAKKRGKPKAGDAPAAKGIGGRRRRTRSQAGGDSADQIDSGEAGADAPVRRPVTRKNSAKAEQEEVDVGEAAGRKHQLKRKTRENDTEDVDVREQVGVSRRSTRSSSLLLEPDDALSSPVEKKRRRKKAAEAKEKTRVEEQPTEALHTGRTLRSGLVVVAPVPSIVSESKKSKREVQEEEPAVEKVAEVEISRRTTRSSAVAAPLTSTSVITKKRGRKTEDVHLDGGPDKKTENKRQSSRLTTHSSIHHPASTEEEATLEQVAAPSKGLPPRRSRRNPSEANVMLNSNTTSESSRPPTEGNGAKDGIEDGVEELDQHVGLKKSKLRKGSATVATSGASATDMQIEVPGPVRRFTRKSVVPSSLEHETKGMHEDVGKKQTVTKPAGRSTRRSVAPVMLEKESKGLTKEIVPEDVEKKQTVTKPAGRSTRSSVAPVVPGKESKGLTKEIVPEDVEKKQTVTKPVGRSTRSSGALVIPGKESKGLTKEIVPEDVEKKQTVMKPVGRSTRRSVALVIPGKESKGLTEEIVPEAHVKRPTRKSVVPAMLEKGRKKIITEIIPEARVKRSTRKPTLPTVNSENNDHCDVVGTENIQSDTSEELEKQPTVKQPVRRLTRKSAVPAMPEKDRKGVSDMLNDENGDPTEMQSDKAGHLEKQLVVKVPVSKTASKSVVPDVIEEENKGLREDLKSEVSVRTPACKSVVPNAVNKENKDHSAFVRTEELSVKTRSAHTSLQVALQNDERLRRTTRRSSIAISPPQSKPTASKGRPAKRRRTSSLQEDMPAEEQKEEQIAYGAHTNDVIEATTSTDLEIGVLPVAAEKSDLRDSQVNSELEDMVVVDPCLSRDEDDIDNLDFELEGTVGTTEKPPSNLPIRDIKHVDALSEEAVHSIENDAGRCSANDEQSPTGPQFLFSQGIAERSATHNALPCPENSVEESDVHKVECQVEIAVSSKSDSYQGSDENSARVEESGGCTFSSQQNNEQEGFPVSSCPKDLAASAQLDPPEDADHAVRDVYTKDLIYKEEEKKDCIPSLDINVPHDTSPASEPAENASGISGAAFCISQSTPISDELNSDSSRSESPDASDNRIASSIAEAVQQDNKECDLHIEVTHDIHASGISEAAQVEVPESGKMPLPDVETSAFRDAQLNRKQEGNEFVEHSFSCSKDECGKNNTSQPANEYVMDSSQEQELKLSPDLSAAKSPKGSTICQGDFVIGSVIGQISGSIVEGNNIAMDAPGTAKQGVNLNPSATALHMNKENAPSYKTDAPEVSCDHLFVMDSSAGAVQSVTGRLREAGLAVGNSDNKLNMEQVQQDDVQGLEGTLESTSLGSGTPESNQQRGLSEEAEPPSLKNERCSSTVEQSPFGLQSLFLQNDLHVQKGILEKTAIVSATPVCKREYGLPDKAEAHSLKNAICPSSSEHSPFGLHSLSPSDVVHVEKGTLEKAALGSVTPEGKHDECGLPDEAEPQSLKEIQSSSVEQSPFGLQSLFSQDDTQVQEGTLEKAELGSVTPEGKHECGLPDEAEPHSLKEIRSSSVEQSPFGLQSLFSQDDTKVQEGTIEKAALGSVTPEGKHECGLPDEAEPHSVKEIRSSSVEQSPFGLQSLFSQDDTQVQEGTLEKAALGSVTPEGKHESGLPDEVEPHSSKNDRCSCVEQSPFGQHPLFSQERIEEPSEKVALAVHAKNRVDESKDVHVEHGVEKPSVPKSVSDHDRSVDFSAVSKSEDCMYTSDEVNEYKGLTKSCHEQEQMACQLDLSEAANCVKDFTDPEEVSYDEENKKPVHSTDISSSCEEIDANEPVKHASGLGDGLLSSSLIASTEYTDVHSRSSPNKFESTDFRDEPKGYSSTEALQQGLEEQCDEAKENKVTLLSSSPIASTDDTYVHPSSNRNQFESTDFLDEPKGCSSSEALQQGLKEHCDEPKENKVTLLSFNPNQFESTDFLDEQKGCSGTEALQQGLKEQCDEPEEYQVILLSSSLPASTDDTDVHQSSNPDQFDSTDFLDEPKGCSSSDALQQGLKEQCDEPKENQDTYEACPSDRTEADTAKDLETEVPPLPAEEASNILENSCLQESSKRFVMPDDLVLPSAENEDDSNVCHVEKMASSEPDSSKGSDMHADLVLPSAEDKDDSIAFHVEHEKYEHPIAPLLAAETSAFPDEQANPKLEAFEYEKYNFSSEDTSQLEHEKHEQVVAPLLAAETSALPDEQANPELGAGEFEKCNFSSEDTSQLEHEKDEQPIAPLLAAETSALPDEQANTEQEAGGFEKCNFSSDDTGGKIATGYVKTNLLQLHEDYPTQEKKVPDDLPAPQSPEQSTIGLDAETSVWPDEQPNPELEAGEFEERNLTNEDTSGIFGTAASVKTDLFQLHEDYPIQGKKLLDDLPAPKSPEQSIAGQDAGTSARLDEQPSPELEADEFEERNFSSKDTSGIVGDGYDEDNLFQLDEYSRMDPSQGKELPNYVPAPKSPQQSLIAQDENALGSETSPLPDEKFYPELEDEEFKEHNFSCDKAASYIFSSGSVKNNTCHWGDKEEYNEHNDDQATAAMLSSGMTKPTLIEGSESGMALLSAAGTPALADEQLNYKLEDDTEQNFCFDTDTSNFNLFSLLDDAHTETCYERELPIGMPAAKSAGASAVCADGSVPGSVGTCQTSISTKLQRFKISSAVKASYIAMGSANTNPGENPMPISLLGNSEDVPAAANPDDPAELNTD